MQTPSDSLLKAIGAAIGDQVGKAFAALRGRIDGIEQRLNELPKPEKGDKGDSGPQGKDAPTVDFKAVVDAVVAMVPAPGKGVDGKDGRDGKDAPPLDTEALARKVLALVPVPANGKDADPVDTKALADEVLARVPVPRDGIDGKDGKDAAPVDTKALAEEVLARIPIAQNGKDADPVDVDALAKSITNKVLDQIPEPKHGEPGKDGASVDLDAVRILLQGLVLSEVNKAVSEIPRPKDGRKGDVGIDGKDAADLDPLPGIDESLSYQKGTWAFHRGGLIKSCRTTDPIKDGDVEAAGWAIAMNGIHEIVETLALDGRTVIKSHVMTSGKSIVTKYKSYQQINQGVWKQDREYERGDIATMAGSSWHANQITKDRPGTSQAWTLVTKRGSDASSMNGARK